MKQAMKLVRFLFSTRLTALLFIVFCVAMAVGTFVESIYNTATARIWVYNAWWFEAIMGVFVLNFIGNIKRYRLLRWEKWPVLLLHAAWILIILGAFVTRYFGFEGVMPIREGETTNTFLSEKTYLKVLVDGEKDGNLQRKTLEGDFLFTEAKNIFFSILKFKFDPDPNKFNWSDDFDSQEFSVEYVDFMSNAAEDLIEDPDGEFYLKIVEAGDGNRHDHYIGFGEIVNIHNVLFTLNNRTDGAINIEWDQINDRYTIDTPFGGTSMQMATQTLNEVPVDTQLPLSFRSLYSLAGMQFVFPDPVIRGSYQIVKDEESIQDALTLKISTEGESQTIQVLGAKGFTNDPKKISLGGLDFWVTYGSKQYELPFALKLNDFIAEKYPGTEKSYSSFMSRVSVADYPPFDYDIYMNHILNHKGYRFFQASFDPDEKGTILSVNHDFWGTWITYVGYFILYIGLLGIMFFGKTRFKSLSKTLEKIRAKKAALTAIILLFSVSVFSQNHQHESTVMQDLDSTLIRQAVPVEQAKKFGKLVIQDFGGRMKPVNTFASELLRKVYNSDKYNVNEDLDITLSADQVLLSIQQNPLLWYQVPFIYLKKGNDSLRRLAGIDGEPEIVYPFDIILDENELKTINNEEDLEGIEEYCYGKDHEEDYDEECFEYVYPVFFILPDGSEITINNDEGWDEIDIWYDKKADHASFIDFFNKDGSYKLAKPLEGAYKAATPNQFQKDFIETDRRINLLYSAIEGKVLRIFPVPNDENDKWVSFVEAPNFSFQPADSVIVTDALPVYFRALGQGAYDQADELLEIISKFQRKYGNDIMPSEKKIDLEIQYNSLNIFYKLFIWYMCVGTLMFLILIFQILFDIRIFRFFVYLCVGLISLLFVAQTVGMGARWYISGHAPWSDAYESMLYVAWATVGMGLAFGRKSKLTVAATAFVASMVLMIAHWNWMDPEIANLVPVLDSYWLMIHVAVIVGSYGPFALGMIVGFIAMILMILTTKKTKKRIRLTIDELTVVNELALTVGVVMLTIGNFLGGQWANESWGRYWGWDPKETWALISILVYAFVLHMRLIPGMRSKWLFNLMSVFAFASIIMTYFGVNFYLVGLHSYASGDKVITPSFVYYSIAIVSLVGLFSFIRYNKYFGKNSK